MAGITVCLMRTTILLDDALAARLQRAARDRGLSLSAFLAEAGRAALGARARRAEEPFELIVQGGSGTHPGIDLDRAGALLADEDEARYGR